MNYEKIYNNIIEYRKVNIPNGYTEFHHIIPKSLGGTDEKINLVELTAREHFICHLLLTKIYKSGSNHYKMIRAFFMMKDCKSDNQYRYITGKSYEKLKKELSMMTSKNQSGKGNSQYGMIWIHNIDEKVSKKISKLDIIPDGWNIGRVTNFELKDLKNKNKQIKEYNKIKARLYNIKIYTEWYEIYKKVGWVEFVKLTGYTKSKPNFVSRCADFVEGFIPQNGKKR
jgi:hypothetical protein